MTDTSIGDAWQRLALLESRRRTALQDLEASVRELYTATQALRGAQGSHLFERYCHSAELLESALAELEQCRWSYAP